MEADRKAGTESAELLKSKNNVVFLATQNRFPLIIIIIIIITIIIIKHLLQKTIITIRVTILTIMPTWTLAVKMNFKIRNKIK